MLLIYPNISQYKVRSYSKLLVRAYHSTMKPYCIVSHSDHSHFTGARLDIARASLKLVRKTDHKAWQQMSRTTSTIRILMNIAWDSVKFTGTCWSFVYHVDFLHGWMQQNAAGNTWLITMCPAGKRCASTGHGARAHNEARFDGHMWW